MNEIRALIDKLNNEHFLELAEWEMLIRFGVKYFNLKNASEQGVEVQDLMNYIRGLAVAKRKEVFSNEVYVRGLIEISNYCKNNCYYCGIRRDNNSVDRYRLTEEEILSCVDEGYELGFRTFVLQGGEDAWFNDDRLCKLIEQIKAKHKDVAITLSLGERSRDSFERLYAAGADRYLLRHETADKSHYELLHPQEMSFDNRMKCLQELKEIGYQVGCGFMVGSPFQTEKALAKDMYFIQEFKPHMVGIGPFIPHHSTSFKDEKGGSLELTLYLLSLLRILNPSVLLPATTALGTIHPEGRERGILSGANVVMPNLSPTAVREKYELYDNKICTGDESAQCKSCLSRRMESIGYEIVVSRGDSPDYLRDIHN